ncbi:tRNA pseudouridine synthase-like 1, partial [Brachionus plicatilis]
MASTNLRRFFIEFSYNGSRFSGVAKQLNSVHTVHNVIFKNLKESFGENFQLKSNICISSRTDAGVHALSNTAHFDLETLEPNCYDGICAHIKNKLNNNFIQHKNHIRILDCREVGRNFVSRHAKSRTYLYRLAYLKNGPYYWDQVETVKKIDKLLKNSHNHSMPYLYPLSNYLSIFDSNCVTELNEPIDKDLFFEAIKLFNGHHNFSAFTTKQGRVEMIDKNKNPLKLVDIKLKSINNQFMSSYLNKYHENYEIFELEIKSTSFLYKMIRKMVGAASDAAKGIIPIEQISNMLTEPQNYYDQKLTSVMKPHGL